MNKEDILDSLNPEIIAKFRTAIELGKWDNGVRLTDEQRQTCMQAVMVWEHEHLPVEERTGYIQKPKDDKGNTVGEECDVEHEHHYPNAERPVNFKN